MKCIVLLACLVAVVLAGNGNPNRFSPYSKRYISYYATSNLTHELEGYLVAPRYSPREKLPAVIVFHHFMGRDNFTDDQTRKLAELGYVAFAADTYGKGVATNNVEQNFGLMGMMLSERTTTLRDRILAAWNYVNSLSFVDKNRIGTVGYCYGGLVSLDLARFDLGAKAAVSFHGTLTNYPNSNNALTRTSIQAHHGDADVHTDESQVTEFHTEMRARNGDWTFTRYSQAQHAYTFPGIDALGIPGAQYNKVAADRSWKAMKLFLDEKL